MAIGN
jgi:class 3 adenylate cyclase